MFMLLREDTENKVCFELSDHIEGEGGKDLYYRPFHKTLPRSCAFVNWISVRFYEMDCTQKNIYKKKTRSASITLDFCCYCPEPPGFQCNHSVHSRLKKILCGFLFWRFSGFSAVTENIQMGAFSSGKRNSQCLKRFRS